MKRRLGPFFAIGAWLAASVAGAVEGEVRGLWVVRTGLQSPEAVDRVVDDAEAAGLNLLLVQVRGRGDAFYQSRVASRSPLLSRQPASFDPLARLLARAGARGIGVHAWVNVLLSAHFGQPLPKDHVLVRHPEWIMVPRACAAAALQSKPRSLPGLVTGFGRDDSDVEGLYLSPWAPGVTTHLEDVIVEIVHRYPVQGIHFDFIRLPGPEYDYSGVALEAFRRSLGARGDPLALPTRHQAAWDDFRRAGVTEVVTRLTRAVRKARAGLVVSAAVAPYDVQAVSQKFQDWPRWLDDGLLDALCPMVYTTDDRTYRSQVEQAVARTRPGQPVWAGIGAWRQTTDEVLEKVRLARAAGAAGVVLFSHESLSALDGPRLKREGFTAPPVGGEVRVGRAGKR